MFTKRMAVKKNNLFRRMASYNLSEGSLEVIMQGGDYEEPIMQVLGIRSVPSSADKQRHRIMLSDGKNSVSLAMLTVPITETAEKKHLTAKSVIKVLKFVTSIVNDPAKGEQRVILLILNFDLIAPGREVGNKIGSPTPLEVSVQGLPTFIGNSTSAVPAPRAASSTNSNISPNNSTLNTQLTHPIASLTPYHNKWILKARVTSKSAIRTWSNFREGKIFTIELVDESGRIRCTGFKEAVDKFYDFIQVDKVYYISKCQLKTANKQYSTLKNDYEMTMTEETVIQECTDVDSSSVPQTKYEFVTIDKIPNLKPNTMVEFAEDLLLADLKKLMATSTSCLQNIKKSENSDASVDEIPRLNWFTRTMVASFFLHRDKSRNKGNSEDVIITVDSKNADAKQDLESGYSQQDKTDSTAKKLKLSEGAILENVEMPSDMLTKNIQQVVNEECEMFGQLMAKRFQQMEQIERDYVMHEIENIMDQAKLRFRSVQNNPQSPSFAEHMVPVDFDSRDGNLSTLNSQNAEQGAVSALLLPASQSS